MDKKNFRNRRLISYGLRTKDTLITGFVLTIITVLLDLVGPYVIGMILDGELIDGIGPRDPKFYGLLIGVYGLTALVSSVTRYGNIYFFNKTANRVCNIMQEDVFSHIQDLPISYFDSLPVGKVVSRITNDTQDVKVLYRVVLSQLSMAVIYAIGIYITLFNLDYRLGLLGLAPLPVIYFIFVHFRDKSKEFNYAYRRYLSDLNANLNENIEGMEIIHAYNREDLIYEEFSELNDNVYKEGVNYTKLISYSGRNAINNLSYLTIALALLFFGYSSLTGLFPVTIGMLYIFVDYMVQVFDHLSNAVMRAGELEKSTVAADHIFELLQLPKVDYGDKKSKKLVGRVVFDDVTFAYEDDNYVLKNVDFSLEPGTSAAFVGHTGSGKSTIMNLLFGFYKPNFGRVEIDGMDIHDYKMREIREEMSIVLQDPYLFTGSIHENISLFDPSISAKDSERALREVGGGEILAKLSKGVHSPIREGGSGLSAGERQLISFARAIVKDPKILVLDEATSNIDSETEAYIQRGIEKLKEGRTTILIAHRLSTIKDSDKIFVLDHGRIVEEGKHDDLCSFKGIYREMYEAQS